MNKTEEELIWEAYQYRHNFKIGETLYVVGETNDYDENHKNNSQNKEMFNDIDILSNKDYKSKHEINKEVVRKSKDENKRFFEKHFPNLDFESDGNKIIKGKGGAVFNNVEDATEFVKLLKQEYPNYDYYRFELDEPYKSGDIGVDDGIPILTKPKTINYDSKVFINI